MSLGRRLYPGNARISAVVGLLALPLLASCAYDAGYYDPSPGYGYDYGYGGYGYNYGYHGNPCWPYGCDDWHHGRHHRHGWGDGDDGDNSHHHHHGGGDGPGGGAQGGGPSGGPGPQANNGPKPPFPYLVNPLQRDSRR